MEVPSIFLNRILTQAAKKNASSVHLTVGSLPVMRVDDRLVEIKEENITTVDIVEKIIDSIANETEKKKLKEEKEIILIKELASGFRFKINIYYQKSLPSITFNYIPNTFKSFSDLKLPKILNDIIKLNSGFFIIAGSYASGKTTTVAAVIEEINKNYKKNIITIEDPIEYLFVSKKSLISQRQVGKDVKSVVQGLKHCLNEDADVVYIGKIKKEFNEAVPLVLDLAAGNSLVFMEINADSSIRAIDKVLDSIEIKKSTEAARFSLADVLLGVIVQKLVPKIGGGIVMAVEIVLATGAVKSLIREGKIYQLESIIQTSRKEGMISMEKAIDELIRSGEIKQEDVESLKLDN